MTDYPLQFILREKFVIWLTNFLIFLAKKEISYNFIIHLFLKGLSCCGNFRVHNLLLKGTRYVHYVPKKYLRHKLFEIFERDKTYRSDCDITDCTLLFINILRSILCWFLFISTKLSQLFLKLLLCEARQFRTREHFFKTYVICFISLEHYYRAFKTKL